MIDCECVVVDYKLTHVFTKESHACITAVPHVMIIASSLHPLAYQHVS